ncbi:hypothetical protein GW17_00029300 [Ensete ventricosum]|nr:hypothetical protein GW17_00029300 [Ensete ventricosum]
MLHAIDPYAPDSAGRPNQLLATWALSILANGLCSTKLTGQLAYQAWVMTFGIRADLVLGHDEGSRVGKDYQFMESEESSRRRVIIELHLTCTMLQFDLGYVGLDEDVKPLSGVVCGTLISLTSEVDKTKIDL